MRLKTKPWRDVHAEPASKRRVITPEAIVAAYQQGKRDFAAGRSINAPRYADKQQDEAWERGFLDALRKHQSQLNPPPRKSCRI